MLRERCGATFGCHEMQRKTAYSDADLDYATIVAAQVGAAIAAGERLAKISRLAYTDPLTGLANRRAVDERLDAALEAHDVEGQPGESHGV